MNQEGMDDRAYFSDWGGCTCDPETDAYDPDCPLWDGLHDDDEEEENQ